jgi:multiple sugar transport system substrate-binding protein
MGAILAACAAPAAPTAAPAAPAAPAAQPKPTEAPAAAAPKATEPPPKVITPSPEPTPALAQVAVGPGQTKVDWWTPRGDKVGLDAAQKVQQAYVKSQDKIVVQIVYVPVTQGTQMSEKLLTSIAAGTPPDTAEFDRFIVASWAAKGSLEDLTDMAKSAGVSADQYYKFSWDEASYKGKLYAMPFDTDTRGIYINNALAKDAGLDITKTPKTVAELDQWAEKLTKKDGRKFVYWGYSPAFRQSFHFAVGLQFEGSFFDMDKDLCTANEPRIVEAFTWMKTYADKYNIEDMEAFQSAFGTQVNDPFMSGQIAMISDGDWQLATIKQFKPDLDFTVIPMPGKAGEASCMAGGWSQVLPKGTKHKTEGFAWLSYYAGKAGQLSWNLDTMHIPTNIEASRDPGFRANPKHAMFMDFLQKAKNRPPIPAGQMLWTSLGEAQSAIRHGKQTPQQAMDDVTKKTNDEEAKYK